MHKNIPSEQKLNEIKRKSLDYYKELYNNDQITADFAETFPYLCLYIFFQELLDDKQSIKESLDCLNTNDYGCDAWFVDEEEKIVHICQFKTTDNINTPPKREWLSDLRSIEERISSRQEPHPNPKVQELVAEYPVLKKQKYIFQYHLFYTIDKEYHEDLSFNDTVYYNLSSIYTQSNEIATGEDFTDPESCIINFCSPENKEQSLNIYIPSKQGKNFKTCIGIVNGKSLVELFENYGNRLFDKNIRYFLSKTTKVNKNMIETAKNKPNLFYYYNNGITIACNDFKQEGELTLKLDQPQIINGGQTVRSLVQAHKETSKDKSETLLGKIMILTKIIMVPKTPESKEAEGFSQDNITKYNNSNNPIRDSDFKSNKAEQEKIQKYMYDLGYFYELKRGEWNFYKKEENNDKHNNIKNYQYNPQFKEQRTTLEDLTQIYCAYKLKEPVIARNKKKDIFSSEKGINNTYFDTFLKDPIDKNTCKEMIFSLEVYKIIDKLEQVAKSYIKNPEKLTDEDNKLLLRATGSVKLENKTSNIFAAHIGFCKLLIISAVSLIIERAIELGSENEDYVITIYNSKEELQKILSNIIRPVFQYIQDGFKKSEEHKAGNLSNYYKKNPSWEDLKQRLERLDDIDFIEKFKFSNP